MMIKVEQPKNIISKLIPSNGYIPNNQRYPFLIYRSVCNFKKYSVQQLQQFLLNNQWYRSWVNGIYNYHHYHSNNHEVLIIYSGQCKIEIGGANGHFFDITAGDVIIHPASVSHKNLASSEDFVTIGAYAFDNEYDMNYGKAKDHPKVDQNIKNTVLPAADPIYGNNGLIFDHWLT